MLEALPGWGRRPYVVHDVYTRHHREQLLGTPWSSAARPRRRPEGCGCTTSSPPDDTGVLAATFVHRVSPLDEGGEPALVPDRLVAAAQGLAMPAPTVRRPPHDLDRRRPAGVVALLDEARGRDLAMRHPRRVTADECDAAGRYIPELAPMLVWARRAGASRLGPWLEEMPGGELMGWASMETRIQTRRLPRWGRVQSFGATVAVHDKVTHRVHWCFGLDRASCSSASRS